MNNKKHKYPYSSMKQRKITKKNYTNVLTYYCPCLCKFTHSFPSMKNSTYIFIYNCSLNIRRKTYDKT